MADLYPSDRLRRAADATADAGYDALLLTPGADLRYLTGYDALVLPRLTCLVLPARGEPVLVVPELERPAALASPAGRLDLEIVGWPETADPFALVASRVGQWRQDSPKRVGVANRMWAEHLLRLRAALPAVEQRLAGEVLHRLRVRKSAAEVEALRRAGAAIDRVHARMAEWLRPGRSEEEVGRDIAGAIVDEGHKRVNFVIVGSGPNGASPHHDLGARRLCAGDTVVVDIGGTTADGYCSDSTRTYSLGEPPPEVTAYYDVLLAAQLAACEAVRPGVSAEAVDRAAREIIEAAGYGERFVHRTGHGIGLEEHEQPWIVAGNLEPLEPGMAFSVEPGIYLPGHSGARIEDILVCTGSGGQRLNTVPRELAVLEV